ncbi:DUF3667 domain-containing protein [Roseateles sp. DAIF2]|uniref:DUF3667 domain-containing protein n=1 Tax=Roseateles sp. DAIF2 TaxID=2714952 RepID=UPI001BC8F455|nr:DUF3667 domain-containing protein [Roseateles sp. DAIF2]
MSSSGAKIVEAHAADGCANCGVALRGAFCHGCGQSAHVHRSLAHLVEESLHGLLHFETKAWRTLPALLWRPGRLTRDYIDGQRARYVSPLALFLFMVFLMFFTFALTGGDAQTTREQAAAVPRMTSDAPITEERLHQGLLSISPLLARPALERRIVEAVRNPELMLHKMKAGAGKFAFLLVPISLPFLWLLFARRRGVALFDHAVFLLYSLAAMALLLSLAAVLGALGWEFLALLLVLFGPPRHIYVQLRDAYGLGPWSAGWRCVALLGVALLVLALYMLLVAAASL